MKTIIIHGFEFKAERKKEPFRAGNGGWNHYTWFSMRYRWTIYNSKGKKVCSGFETLKDAISVMSGASKKEIERDFNL